MVLGTCISLVLGTRVAKSGNVRQAGNMRQAGAGIMRQARDRNAHQIGAGNARQAAAGNTPQKPQRRLRDARSRGHRYGCGWSRERALSGPRRGRDVGFGFPYLGYYRAKISAEDVAGELLNARGGRDADGFGRVLVVEQ